MNEWIFQHAHWFWASALLPFIFWLRSRRRASALIIPFASAWYHPTLQTTRWLPQTLAGLGLIFLILALARPQQIEDKREVNQEGYDLMLAIDLSTSMLTEDFEKNGERINRLQAIKPIIQAFIQKRPNDRIGLVIFSGQAYTLAPLTFDHAWLQRQAERLRIGLIKDGTAIGDGLGVALTRLEQAARQEANRRKGAFVILLTDGSNNAGFLQPEDAADIAQSRGIPVYTIAAGREGIVPFPRFDQEGRLLGYVNTRSDIDEATLQKIAQKTGGRFFRAQDRGTIQEAFATIDQAQKIEFQAKSYLLAREHFQIFTALGIFLILFGALLLPHHATGELTT